MEESEPARCFRFFSMASISDSMFRRNSLDEGFRWRRSGRVRGDPSMNLDGRGARLGTFVAADGMAGFCLLMAKYLRASWLLLLELESHVLVRFMV